MMAPPGSLFRRLAVLFHGAVIVRCACPPPPSSARSGVIACTARFADHTPYGLFRRAGTYGSTLSQWEQAHSSQRPATGCSGVAGVCRALRLPQRSLQRKRSLPSLPLRQTRASCRPRPATGAACCPLFIHLSRNDREPVSSSYNLHPSATLLPYSRKTLRT